LTKETKQEHDFAGLIWFTRKQNQYLDVSGTLNVTNELLKTKHSLNIDMNQWVLRSRVNIWKETRIHKLLNRWIRVPCSL